MRFAYADPPYPGMSARYYGDHEDFAGEVDHAELLDRLIGGFPDGWALSTSSKTLRDVLALVPAEVTVRIGAWTKPMPPGAGRRARCGWEPVLFAGGRPRPDDAPTLLDWIYAAPPRAIPGQVTGTKPAEFARWVFDCLGAAPGDELADLFPGSGAIGRAWERYVDLAPATRRPSRTERVARADLRAECLGGHDVAGPVCPQCILDASRSAAATP
jgi:hypothetical protein